MKITFRQFLAAMKKIALKPQERAQLRPTNSVIKSSPVRHISVMEQEFFQSAKEVRLHPQEKVALKEALLGSGTQPAWWVLRSRSFTSVVASLLIITMVGGTASYTAEGAVPGDALYPIKYLHEEVRGRLMQSEEGRARWEALRAERRLQEAEVLTTRGEASATILSTLETEFQKHASAVEVRLADMHEEKEEKFTEITTRFDAALKKRTQELRKNTTSPDAVEPLLKKVHSTRVRMRQSALERAEARNTAAVTTMPQTRVNKRATLELQEAAMKSHTPSDDDTGTLDNDKDSEKNIHGTIPASDLDDLLVETEARLNIARKHVYGVQVSLPPAPSAAVMTELNRANVLLNQAEMQLNAGKVKNANENLTAALQHVDTVRAALRATDRGENTTTVVPTSATPVKMQPIDRTGLLQ